MQNNNKKSNNQSNIQVLNSTMNNRHMVANIRINYIFSFIKGIDLTSGIWMIYLVFKGMNLLEVGMLEGIYHITSLLMETPTGAIADLFGRKSSRIIGLFFRIVSAILMVTSQSFLGCAVAFVLTALSNNFESGAAEALVYDSLKSVNKEGDFMKITGRLEVIFQLSSVIGLLLGGFIGTISYPIIYLIVGVLTVVLIGVALFFREPSIHTDTTSNNISDTTPSHTAITEKVGIMTSLKNQYVDSYKILRGNHRLMYIILFGAIISTFLTLSFFYMQIAWKEYGYSEWQIGLFLALSSIFGAFGGWVADKVDKRFGDVYIMKYFPFVMVVAIPTFYFTQLSVISFSLICTLESIIFVATRDYINQLIPSEKRATILSFDSAVFSFCMITLFPVFGWIADNIGIGTTFLFLGGVFLLLTVVNTQVLRRDYQ